MSLEKKKILLQAILAIMAKVRINSDIIKPFSGEGDVVAWLKKVRLVARFQNVDDVASLLLLYLERNALALYMEMEEASQRDIEQIEAQLKEAFTDNAFAAYRKLTMVRWAGERMDVFTNKIRQLIGLAGFEGAEMVKLTKLAFVTGFPNTISIELLQSPNIKAMTMEDLLARARVLTMTEDPNQDMIAAVCSSGGGATPPGKSGPNTSVTCYRCKCKGHTAKNCWKRGTRCYQYGEDGHWVRDCPGHEAGGQGISASLLPNEDLNTTLPVANIYINGMQCLALVDTSCSQMIVDADQCRSWRRAAVDVMTIVGMSHSCCCVGTVTVAMDGGNSAKISVLVVHDKPLEYDLPFGINAIRALGGVAVWPSGQIRISSGLVPKCAAITINKPDFTITFNQQS